MRLLLLLMLFGVTQCMEDTCESEETPVTMRLPTTEGCDSPTETPSYWYQKYLYTPCNETSPILRNEEHDGTHIDAKWKIYPAESYYLECQEGKSDVPGAWGGYNYGGCIGTNEDGIDGSLKSLSLKTEFEHFYTNAGESVDPFGITWTCQDRANSNSPGPPSAFAELCWYHTENGDLETVSPVADETDDMEEIEAAFNGETFSFYCLYNSPYGEGILPKHVYTEEIIGGGDGLTPEAPTTTEKPVTYWYEEYLRTPCNETSPILRNEEHDGTHIDAKWKIYPAQSYYLECQEGKSDVPGAWGGYNYGGCIGTNEEGVDGSLMSFSLKTEFEHFYTNAGVSVDPLGLVWTCQDRANSNSPGPPSAFDELCWYYAENGDLVKVSPIADDTDYEEERHTSFFGGGTFLFYCLYNSPYGEGILPRVVYPKVMGGMGA